MTSDLTFNFQLNQSISLLVAYLKEATFAIVCCKLETPIIIACINIGCMWVGIKRFNQQWPFLFNQPTSAYLAPYTHLHRKPKHFTFIFNNFLSLFLLLCVWCGACETGKACQLTLRLNREVTRELKPKIKKA